MNNMTQPRFTKNEDYFLAVLNWPNGKIAIVFAVIFIAGVTYGVATKQGDIFDLVKDFGSCFWLAAYFNSLSISKSIINKIEKSLTDNKDVQAAA